MTRDKLTDEKVGIHRNPNYSGYTNFLVHPLSIFKSR